MRSSPPEAFESTLLSRVSAYDQMLDLERLTRDHRPDQSEVFIGNAFYGFGRVMRMYAGIPLDRPVRAVIPHGVYLSDTCVSAGELGARLPAVLSFPSYRDNVYDTQSNMAVVPCASPFLYSLRLVPEEDCVRCGSVFFPAHSLIGVEAAQSWDVLADLCAQLPSRYQPVDVCVHFEDVLAERHLPMVERGLRVLCAGHRHDVDFTVRLVRLLRSYTFCLTNELGSHVFYAAAAGCDVELLGPRPQWRGDLLAAEAPKASQRRQREIDGLHDLLSSGRGTRSDTATVADFYLRADCLMTPEKLREVLVDCARLDLGGRLFAPGFAEGRNVMPTAAPRLCAAAVSRIRAVTRRLWLGLVSRLRRKPGVGSK